MMHIAFSILIPNISKFPPIFVKITLCLLLTILTIWHLLIMLHTYRTTLYAREIPDIGLARSRGGSQFQVGDDNSKSLDLSQGSPNLG